ncbi:hypothetical protein JG688_00014137 [Phytophthora aleatoria]|uniref:Uncharacterized protein n=1 Tax=Phytophthora aleatoria TaxID=2496075 RepID=A0A8J5M3H0_9STRA|nr:hypothetical protein JG688_00014137 [Phytophthora aleatoria]
MSKPKLSHIAFLKQLHLELCQLDEPDWDTVRRTQGLQGTPTKRRATTGAVDHTPVLNEEMRKGNRRAAQKDGKERVKCALSSRRRSAAMILLRLRAGWLWKRQVVQGLLLQQDQARVRRQV